MKQIGLGWQMYNGDNSNLTMASSVDLAYWLSIGGYATEDGNANRWRVLIKDYIGDMKMLNCPTGKNNDKAENLNIQLITQYGYNSTCRTGWTRLSKNRRGLCPLPIAGIGVPRGPTMSPTRVMRACRDGTTTAP